MIDWLKDFWKVFKFSLVSMFCSLIFTNLAFRDYASLYRVLVFTFMFFVFEFVQFHDRRERGVVL